MRYLFIAFIVLSIYAEDKPVPQPLEVQRTMAEYEKGIYQIRKVYDAAAVKVADSAIVSLDKAKKDYMAKGDLEGATLVAAAIKKIKDGEALAVTEERIKEASANNLLKPTPEQMVVGRWRASHSNGSKDLYIFNADKTVRGLSGEVKNTWEITNNVLIIKWGANIDSYDVITMNHLEGKNSSNIKLILNREK